MPFAGFPHSGAAAQGTRGRAGTFPLSGRSASGSAAPDPNVCCIRVGYGFALSGAIVVQLCSFSERRAVFARRGSSGVGSRKGVKTALRYATPIGPLPPSIGMCVGWSVRQWDGHQLRKGSRTRRGATSSRFVVTARQAACGAVGGVLGTRLRATAPNEAESSRFFSLPPADPLVVPCGLACVVSAAPYLRDADDMATRLSGLSCGLTCRARCGTIFTR